MVDSTQSPWEQSAMSEAAHLVELERQLAEDTDGKLCDHWCEQLTEQRQALQRTIDAGLPPDEFQRAEKVLSALDAAVHVLRTLWQHTHARGAV